jgi:hypothetical protein
MMQTCGAVVFDQLAHPIKILAHAHYALNKN